MKTPSKRGPIRKRLDFFYSQPKSVVPKVNNPDRAINTLISIPVGAVIAWLINVRPAAGIPAACLVAVFLWRMANKPPHWLLGLGRFLQRDRSGAYLGILLILVVLFASGLMQKA